LAQLNFSDGSSIAKVKDPTMKKTLLLLFVALTLMTGTGRSQMTPTHNFTFKVASVPGNATSFHLGSSGESATTRRITDFASGLHKAGGASFAQLNGGTRAMPLPSVGLLTLVAVGVLFWRGLDVRRAKALADNEHHINRSREQMYRSLYKHD
jgi:hypothetical protein